MYVHLYVCVFVCVHACEGEVVQSVKKYPCLCGWELGVHDVHPGWYTSLN